MDRNRLKEMHQSDLTESRVNEDFVNWLKTSGPTYLLVVLVGLCAYVLWVRWNERQDTYVVNAWGEYVSSQLPSSLEDVASKYEDVGALPYLARLDAAQMLLKAVQTDEALGGPGEEATIDLSPEERTQYLDRADGLYQRIIDADDRTEPMTLVAVSALFGKAAVAECRGETEQARGLYERAATRAEVYFPKLAAQARTRLENLNQVASAAVSLPESAPQSGMQDFSNQRTQLRINPAFADLISPNATTGGGP